MALTPKQNLEWAQRIGLQPNRSGNAIGLYHRDPLPLPPKVRALVRTPLNPNLPDSQQPIQGANSPIQWASQTVNATTEQIISAQPNRVILIVQNLSGGNISVTFDQTASAAGNQGVILNTTYPNLYIDRQCPTGTIHVQGGNPVTITQGFSVLGNIPEYAIVEQLQRLIALVTPKSYQATQGF